MHRKQTHSRWPDASVRNTVIVIVFNGIWETTQHNRHNGLLPAPTCYRVVADLWFMLRTCYSDLLRGNCCNGFWPLQLITFVDFLVPDFVWIAFAELPHGDSAKHHVGGFLGYHDHRGIGITGHDPWHHGRVCYPQSLYSTHPTSTTQLVKSSPSHDTKTTFSATVHLIVREHVRLIICYPTIC